tara:strand:+ start:283 stop:474 length:192 start_codon:yes stop_codon:yes gene_type:complete
MKNSKLLIVLLSVLLVSACDYEPRQIFEIKTVSGDVIKLACPVVDAERGELTYIIDGDCVIYK